MASSNQGFGVSAKEQLFNAVYKPIKLDTAGLINPRKSTIKLRMERGDFDLMNDRIMDDSSVTMCGSSSSSTSPSSSPLMPPLSPPSLPSLRKRTVGVETDENSALSNPAAKRFCYQLDGTYDSDYEGDLDDTVNDDDGKNDKKRKVKATREEVIVPEAEVECFMQALTAGPYSDEGRESPPSARRDSQTQIANSAPRPSRCGYTNRIHNSADHAFDMLKTCLTQQNETIKALEKDVESLKIKNESDMVQKDEELLKKEKWLDFWTSSYGDTAYDLYAMEKELKDKNEQIRSWAGRFETASDELQRLQAENAKLRMRCGRLMEEKSMFAGRKRALGTGWRDLRMWGPAWTSGSAGHDDVKEDANAEGMESVEAAHGALIDRERSLIAE